MCGHVKIVIFDQEITRGFFDALRAFIYRACRALKKVMCKVEQKSRILKLNYSGTHALIVMRGQAILQSKLQKALV